MFKKIVFGVLRHVFTTVGGSGVATGLMTEDELTTAVSSIMTLIGIALSAYNKYSELKRENNRVAALEQEVMTLKSQTIVKRPKRKHENQGRYNQ